MAGTGGRPPGKNRQAVRRQSAAQIAAQVQRTRVMKQKNKKLRDAKKKAEDGEKKAKDGAARKAARRSFFGDVNDQTQPSSADSAAVATAAAYSTVDNATATTTAATNTSTAANNNNNNTTTAAPAVAENNTAPDTMQAGNNSENHDVVTVIDSFDTIALHRSELQDALKTRREQLGDVKLTKDLQYMCDAMGVPLPFLPFSGKAECQLFAKLMLMHKGTLDDVKFALEWCKHVDPEQNIHAKLPCHIRVQAAKFDRNQRIRATMEKAKSGRDLLKELHSKVLPTILEE